MSGECDKSIGSICCCRLAAAVGIVFALGTFLLGAVTMFTTTYGHEMVWLIGNIYWGYEPGRLAGAALGGLWAFVDGFIGTMLVALVYKGLSRAGGCCCCASKPCPAPGQADGDSWA